MVKANYLGPTYNCYLTTLGNRIHQFKPGSDVCTCGIVRLNAMTELHICNTYNVVHPVRDLIDSEGVRVELWELELTCIECGRIEKFVGRLLDSSYSVPIRVLKTVW